MTLVDRIESATPSQRDRAVDALRAFAILGVVLGHWLVTAFVVRDGQLHVVSPLSSQPVLTPASWVFQTLAVFFFVGGYAGARSLSGLPYRQWIAKRLVRLVRPVLVLLAMWALINEVWHSQPLLKIALSPLWFLVVYAGLTALTPLLTNKYLPVVFIAIVALGDVLHLGWVNLPAGWLVPYCLGIAWARGVRPHAWLLLAGGAAATVVLVRWFGYPASMVGVPGDGRSNLNPPSLAAVTFGLAQVGLALLLHGPLTRLMRRPLAWTATAMVNLSAMTIFLWHQTALIAVTTFGLGYGDLPGLHTTPDSPKWVMDRLVWLPVFAGALAVLVALCHRFERVTSAGRTVARSRASTTPGGG